jgi:anti-sigma-K factor RskA
VKQRTHNDHREQAAAFALGALAGDDRLDFESHVLQCAECADDLRSCSEVATALAFATTPLEPSADIRRRTLEALRTVSPVIKTPRRSIFVPWLAAAASLAIATAFGAYTIAQRHNASEAQSFVVVMTADDLQRVDLAGQPAAPGAAARAFWSRSHGLIFTASKLPPLPSGRTYQVWIIAGQTPIGAGLVKPAIDGSVRAYFDAPPGLVRAAAFAVTIEPDGGMPAPTGDRYLVGLVN